MPTASAAGGNRDAIDSFIAQVEALDTLMKTGNSKISTKARRDPIELTSRITSSDNQEISDGER